MQSGQDAARGGSPDAGAARAAIAPFAEPERAPNMCNTYRVTPWPRGSAVAGHDAEQVVDALVKYSRYAAAAAVDGRHDTMGRFWAAATGQEPRTG